MEKIALTRLTVVLIIVILILSGAIYILALKESGDEDLTEGELKEIPFYDSSRKGGIVDTTEAYNMINAYRKKGKWSVVFREKKCGLWHDDSTLVDYSTKKFPKFVDDHQIDDTNYKDYKWQVGFYYSLSRDHADTLQAPTKKYIRLNCLLIPTLVNEKLDINDPSRVLDYYTNRHNPTIARFYRKKGNQLLQDPPPDYIYDTGEIWP